MMWSLMRRGGVRITSLSTGSTPRLQRSTSQITGNHGKMTQFPPLRGRSVHDDVDPQDLHRVERVRQLHHRRQRNESQRGDAPAKGEQALRDKGRYD